MRFFFNFKEKNVDHFLKQQMLFLSFSAEKYVIEEDRGRLKRQVVGWLCARGVLD